jgi:predicted Fe-Mo cluster-binding NifX family protein
MKIAVPVWNGFVSSVFDFAHRLLLVEIENGKEVNRSEVALESQSLPQRAGRLKSLGVDVLVCGAISQALANMVTASGTQVLPYVTGRVDDVLQAHLNGQLVQPQFTMPGFWPGARRGFGRGRRGCRWRGGR